MELIIRCRGAVKILQPLLNIEPLLVGAGRMSTFCISNDIQNNDILSHTFILLKLVQKEKKNLHTVCIDYKMHTTQCDIHPILVYFSQKTTAK